MKYIMPWFKYKQFQDANTKSFFIPRLNRFKMKCSICKIEGHSKRSCSAPVAPVAPASSMPLKPKPSKKIAPNTSETPMNSTVTNTTSNPSKNSLVAKNGNKAEQHICENATVKLHFETYFKKSIQSITRVAGRKKSDNLITFEDGSTAKLQIKDGLGNNRGWSADRRSVEKLPVDETCKTLLKNVCLKKGTDRPVAACPTTLISDLLCGVDEDTKPTHFIHTIFNKETSELEKLCIAPVESILTALQEVAYKELFPKKTCVHISPLMYLQRKGGGSKDHSPDDIQLKIKEFPKDIMICLYDKSQTKTE